MTLRTAFAVLLVTGSMGLGCGASGDGDSSTHADNPHNPNTPSQGIGPPGGVGAAPRDMPGGGRGSSTPHGK